MGNDLLLQNNHTALTQVDPTLNIHDGFVTDYTMIPLDYAIGEVDESDSYDKPTTVSSSRANSIYYENENVGTTKGSKKHPLEGATVQLKVAKTSIGIDKLVRSEEHTSELQSRGQLVCRLLLEKKKA